MDELLRQLRASPGWTDACENLKKIAEACGAEAEASAAGYAEVYRGSAAR
jgi:hypothetical protein